MKTDLEKAIDFATESNLIGENNSFIKHEDIYSIDIDIEKDGDRVLYDAKKLDFSMPNEFNSLASILKDIMAGDVEAMNRPEYSCLNFPQIKAALDWIISNNDLDSTLKSLLFCESWRLNFRARPPTPEEFSQEKYIGDMSESLFPWLKEFFFDFFDPLKPYRSAALTSCIGAGKSQPLDSKVYITDSEWKLMKDIKPGDKVLSPDGSESTVVSTIDWDPEDIYELKMNNGKKFRCGLHHLHHVSYRKDANGERRWDTVETKFILENHDLDYKFQEYNGISKLKNIKKTSFEKTRCIEVSNPNGLYVTDDKIVTHNSTISVLMNSYLAALFALMFKPYKYYGYAPSTVFTLVYAGWSQKKASELLLEPLLNLLRSSPYFEQCRTWDDMIKANKIFEETDTVDKIYWTKASPTSEIMFSNGLNVKIVSSAGDILGQNIVAGTCSELSFFRDNGWSDDKIMKFFTKLRDRIDSRMKRNYVSRFILDSSPNTLESPIDDWIWNTATKDPSIKIFSGSRWKFFKQDFDPACYDENDLIKKDWDYNFPMFKGGNGQAPHVIRSEVEYNNTDTIDIIWCPKSGGGVSMLDKAEMDPIEFLKDWAGVPSGTADRIFYKSEIIENIFDNNLKNIYTSITAPAEEEPEHLIWNQIKGQFFNKVFDKEYFYYDPSLPRALSVDQSTTGDTTCIAVSHIERDSQLNENGEYNSIFVTDFTLVIIPKGGIINLDAIKHFAMDLRDKGNLNIQYISFDAFQSDAQRQWLKRHGFNVEYISVDKRIDPYLNFIDYAFHGRIKCGKNIFYKNNLKSLQLTKRKNTGTVKVDHMKGDLVNEGNADWDTSLIGSNAKDICDAVVANIELINMHSDVFIPYKVWDPKNTNNSTLEKRKENTEKILSNLGLHF